MKDSLRAVLLVIAVCYIVLCVLAVLLLGLNHVLDWTDGESGWVVIGFWLAVVYVTAEIAARTEH